MDLVTQLRYVTRDAQIQLGEDLLAACLLAACMASLCALYPALRALARALRAELRGLAARLRRRGVSALLAVAFAAGLVQYAATKGTGSVSFPYTDIEKRYLTDCGSYVTNGYVHVDCTRSILVPLSADFNGAARPVGSTNDADWVVFLVTDFAHVSFPTNIPYAGAETNDFQFFTTWTPGPTVHTNGVALVTWIANGTNRLALYRTGVYANAFRVAPNADITNGPPVSLSLTLTMENEDD